MRRRRRQAGGRAAWGRGSGSDDHVTAYDSGVRARAAGGDHGKGVRAREYERAAKEK